MPINPLFITDFYKTGHIDQYPEGTEVIYSNLTPRFGKYSNTKLNKVVVAGIRNFVVNFLKHYWDDSFFKRPKEDVVNEYQEEVSLALGKTSVRQDHVEYLHDLGYLPLLVEALPEGAIVPYGVPVLRLTNTDYNCFWLTNYLETVLSNELWKPMTTATTSAYYRTILDKYVKTTNPEASDFVDFQAHDFSARGMSGWVDSTINAVSHLMFFKGTDTVSAIPLIRQLYGDKGFIGGSIPATEHSVICAGSKESEIDTYKRLLTEVYPTSIVSIVSDTWDYFKVLTEHLPSIKNIIESRDGKLVIRPDSGDPADIICGKEFPYFSGGRDLHSQDEEIIDYLIDSHDEFTDDCSQIIQMGGSYFRATYIHIYGEKGRLELEPYEKTPEDKGAIEILYDIFGGSISSTGYKVLAPCIGLIYGDAITPVRMLDILRRLELKKFASTNVVFGVGSYTYNMVSRDTHGFAMRATWAQIKGVGYDLFKQPKTDPSKNSAKGLFSVVKDENDEYTLTYLSPTTAELDLLDVYFVNGNVPTANTFSSTRDRALLELNKEK